MTAGQIWRRADGLRWVEIQTPAVDGSGWRLMVPLLALTDASEAPPLVVTVDRWRARVHLLTGVPQQSLGDLDGSLTDTQVAALQAAVRLLVDDPDHQTPAVGR